MSKTCKGCGEEKPLDKFGKENSKSGVNCRCLSCLNEKNRNWRKAHPESAAASSAKWQRENTARANAKTKRWQARNHDAVIISKRIRRHGANITTKHYRLDPLATEKKCFGCNIVKPITEFGTWRRASDGHMHQCFECTRLVYHAKVSTLEGRLLERERTRILQSRLRKDPQHHVDRRISNAIYCALIRAGSLKGGRRWESLVGYTAYDLKRHLENLFTDGMTWERFVNGEIHIDHRRPKSWFRYTSTDDEQFKQCWSLNNLQPLWALDNLTKHARYAT